VAQSSAELALRLQGQTQGFLVPGMECLLCSLHWPEGLKGEEIKKYGWEGVSAWRLLSCCSPGRCPGPPQFSNGSLATRANGKPEWVSLPGWECCVPFQSQAACENSVLPGAVSGTQLSTPTGCHAKSPEGPCGIISWWPE
jgi:hypothetical protein